MYVLKKLKARMRKECNHILPRCGVQSYLGVITDMWECACHVSGWTSGTATFGTTLPYIGPLAGSKKQNSVPELVKPDLSKLV
jgi:hypothetical protein